MIDWLVKPITMFQFYGFLIIIIYQQYKDKAITKKLNNDIEKLKKEIEELKKN